MIQKLSAKLFDGYRKHFLPRLNESVPVKVNFDFELITIKDVVSELLTLFRPGGGGLWRPYQTLKLNNFKAVKAMTTKFSDFS